MPAIDSFWKLIRLGKPLELRITQQNKLGNRPRRRSAKFILRYVRPVARHSSVKMLANRFPRKVQQDLYRLTRTDLDFRRWTRVGRNEHFLIRSGGIVRSGVAF